MTRDHRDTRQQIVDLAYEKFCKFGFYKVSMDSLVDELRVSKSTIYKYFPSKEDLVQAVINKYTSEIDRKFEELIQDDSLDIMQKMISFTRFYGYMLTHLSDEFLRDIELLTPQLWEQEVNLRVQRFSHYFGQMHDMGVQSGLFRPEIRKEIVVFLYIKMTELVYTKHLETLDLSRPEVFSDISDLFLRGVLTEEGKEKLFNKKYFED